MGAHAVNDRGQVVGVAQTKDGQYHLFLWDREHGIQDLGVTGDAHFDINNAGQIAGAMFDPNGNQQTCLWESGEPRTFLGTLGGKNSHAMAINNRGQVVGASDMPDGSRRAFLWDRGTGMRDLGTLGDKEIYANAINDAGCILGVSYTPQQRLQPFVWDVNDGLVAIDPLLVDAAPFGINNGSWVVGQTPSSRQSRAVAIWRKGTGTRELLPLARSLNGLTLLNDANQIVFSESPVRRSWWVLRRFLPPRVSWYLWDPNCGRIPLDPYIPARRKELFMPTDINNKGCIVGILSSGPKLPRSRAIRLEPIPKRWRK